jgi:hypothetical protein
MLKNKNTLAASKIRLDKEFCLEVRNTGLISHLKYAKRKGNRAF